MDLESRLDGPTELSAPAWIFTKDEGETMACFSSVKGHDSVCNLEDSL